MTDFAKKLIGGFFLILFVGGHAAEAKETTSFGFPGFPKISHEFIDNINTCYYDSKMYVFYEKILIEHDRPVQEADMFVWKGTTYYVTWDGTEWSEEEEFPERVLDVVSDSTRMVVLVEGGYLVYAYSFWSDLVQIEGLEYGSACVSPYGIYFLYGKGEHLVYRLLDGDELSPERIAVSNWITEHYMAVILLKMYAEPVYAFDRLWIFYNRFPEERLRLFYMTFDGQDWSGQQYLVDVMQYRPVVYKGKLYLFYINWMKFSEPSIWNMFSAFEDMLTTSYMVYDGHRWSDAHRLKVGPSVMANMSTDALSVHDTLWLFASSMSSIHYRTMVDDVWGRQKALIPTFFPDIFSGYGVIFYVAFALLTTAVIALIVWLVSYFVEQRKKVLLEIGQKEYECASLFRRYLAYTIDYYVFYPLWFIVSKNFFLSDRSFLYGRFLLAWILIIFVLPLVEYIYHIILEGLWGKTLGKLIMGIKVVSTEGKTCGLKRALIRNILRIVDSFFGYIVGVVIFGTSKEHQRLGDMLGKTYVILDKPKVGPDNMTR